MPKPFQLFVAVEEIALGPVMARLQNLPGVLSVDMVPRGAAKSVANGHAPNGHADGEDKPPHKRKKRPSFEITGADFLIKTLKKGPADGAKLREIFEKAGRAPASVSSLVYNGGQEGLIAHGEQGYHLTKKGRDKSRYVKG